MIHAISKAHRFGWDGFHPVTKVRNDDLVLAELKDLEKAIENLRSYITHLKRRDSNGEEAIDQSGHHS